MNIVILDWSTMCCGDDLSPDIFGKYGNVTAYPLTAPNETISRIGDR